MSDVLTKKAPPFTMNLKNEIITVNRLIFEADICQSIFEIYKTIEININDGAQEMVFRDIKNVYQKMQDFAEVNQQNVQKVMKILPKVTL